MGFVSRKCENKEAEKNMRRAEAPHLTWTTFHLNPGRVEEVATGGQRDLLDIIVTTTSFHS